MANNEEDKSVTLVIGLLMFPLQMLMHAYVAYCMWSWFAVDIFHQTLTVGQCLGLVFVSKAFLGFSLRSLYIKEIHSKVVQREDPTIQSICDDISIAFITPLIFLGLGWVLFKILN